MLKNPIQLRLEKLEPWQHLTFMVSLCERMYPNYVFFCAETEFADSHKYRVILDSIWEILTVKNAKINFENQLEKLEDMVPSEDDFDIYAVSPAIDACVALADLLHAMLDRDLMMETVIKLSALSVETVANLEYAQTGIEITNDNQKENEAVCAEWDTQWAIFRALKEAEPRDIELIKDLRAELRDEPVSNIGIEL
ncbi:YjaG family protein [Photobacterium leiognathi subsp. mandapamensis]|uniref:YjaG family protein n=1 Tax=Photobacterium leiognathi TaxID=553611 RepID=UPI003AF3A7C0